jgi:Ni2+-binding GTPase involved in maturation of urease and hydrogenase
MTGLSFGVVAGLMIRGSSGSGKTSLVKTLIERVYLDPNAMMCQFPVLFQPQSRKS